MQFTAFTMLVTIYGGKWTTALALAYKVTHAIH